MMRTVIYRCPRTGLNVQGWFADEAFAPEDGTHATYESLRCLACTGLHLVNRSTGKLLGHEND
jgi:hypothetical protein